MADRCSCPDQGDAVVFGSCRKCMPNPEQPRSRLTDLPRLLPSWVFVVPETSEGGEPCERHNRQGCWSCMKDQPVLHATSEGVAADNLQQQLDELEPRYLETLDADERGGR